MSPESLRLSKSRYLCGLQCHKQLWWRVHEPEAPELTPTPGQQNLFSQGREVGERARGHVPGGELIDVPFYQYDNKVTATREALKRDLPAIYEAWFLADETYVGVDILDRTSRGHTVIEVKASNSRKAEHLPDAAVQVHVLRRAGLQVERAEVMHLNPECRFPDLAKLFRREDVTPLVEAALIGVPDELAAQQRMLAGPLPDVPIGDHCTRPYDCPFLERCWPKLPDHHVSKLYRIERKRALELEADGYATIYDLPSDLELSVIHVRQVTAVAAGAGAVQRACGAAGRRMGASSVDRRRAGGSATGTRRSRGRGVRGLAPGRGLPRELRARVHQASPGGGAASGQEARTDRETPGGLAAHNTESCVPPGLRGRVQYQEDAAGTRARPILLGPRGAGRRGGDGRAAAADVPGSRDACWRAGRATRSAAALLRAGHLGDGEAAGKAQGSGGVSAGAVLRRLFGLAVLRLELVERRPHGGRVVPLMAAIDVLGAAAPHHAILPGAIAGGGGVLAHVPGLLPAEPRVALSKLG